MSNVVLFSQSGLVEFNTKQGAAQLTGEAALFKGGAALAALKDAAIDQAFTKAANGKFRSAAEIFAVAFPSTDKAFTKLYGATSWANKGTFASYLSAMERAEPGKSGTFNKKQEAARTLGRALRNLPAFKPEPVVVEAGEVVEA